MNINQYATLALYELRRMKIKLNETEVDGEI